MATQLLRSDGKNPIIGDALPIDFTATVPAGFGTPTKAIVTFKRSKSLADNDSGVVQKSITSGFTVSGTTLTFTITLSTTDTDDFLPGKYFWSCRVINASSYPASIVPDGEVIWEKGATDAVS